MECTFLAILNLYQSSWEKLSEKNQNGHFDHSKFVSVFLGKIVGKKFGMTIFGHSKFVPVFLGKIIGKNSGWPFLAIPNLYQSFWEKLSEKIWNGHFGHSEFIPVFLADLKKISLLDWY